MFPVFLVANNVRRTVAVTVEYNATKDEIVKAKFSFATLALTICKKFDRKKITRVKKMDLNSVKFNNRFIFVCLTHIPPTKSFKNKLF